MKDIDEKSLEGLDLGDGYTGDLYPYATLNWKNYTLLYAITLFFVIFVAWASFATVDELARGQGKIVPFSEIQVVQNLEGGIVEAIYVAEGDVVKEGQTLLRMSNIQAGADYQANLKKYQALQAAAIRLRAQADGVTPDFPAALQEDAPQAVALELAAWQANSQQYESQLRILQQQRDQREQEINEVQEKIVGAKKVLALNREEHDMISPLVKRGTVSRVESMQLEKTVAELESELSNQEAALSRAQSAMKEVDERIEEHKNGQKADAQRDLALKTAEMSAQKETLTAYKDKATRTEIRAPVHGTIKDIKVTTVGGVVRPGEPIMEIVPLNDQLIIEAHIPPSSIAFLRPGMPATIKLTAYDYGIYGSISAKVTEISADSLENSKGESFYRVKLQSESTSLRHDGKDLPIIPGMIASVDILTGKKTIMNYLLKPVEKAMKSAMHEK